MCPHLSLVFLDLSGSCHLCMPTSSSQGLFWVSVCWVLLVRVILERRVCNTMYVPVIMRKFSIFLKPVSVLNLSGGH